MRAKCVYEKFTQQSDPIKDLGIGITLDEIKDFYYKVKNIANDFSFWTAADFIIKYKKYDYLQYLLDNYNIIGASSIDHALRTAAYANDLKAFNILMKDDRGNLKTALDEFDRRLLRKRMINPKILQAIYDAHGVKLHMQKIRKYIAEKFAEESDPVKDMGIGLVEKIRKGLTQITNDDKVIKFLSGPIIKQFGYNDKGKLIGYTQFTMPDSAPYIKDSFQRYGLADYVIFNPVTDSNAMYYFTLRIKPEYQRAFKEAISKMNESVNEKFTPISDPLKDMGVGKEHFREELKQYDIRHTFPSLNPEFRHTLENEFGADASEIYYLGYLPLDPTRIDFYDREKMKYFSNLEDLTRGAKKISQKLGATKRSTTITVYKTKIGKVATMYRPFSNGTDYIGDFDVALRIYNKIK